MGDISKGFLGVWNDVTPDHEAEWVRWHTVEHMPERVGVPGFRQGRRYIDRNMTEQRFLTIYLGDDVSTFASAGYIERLNNPTPWTTKMMPHFRNFLRGACQITAGAFGPRVGGSIAAIRVKRKPGFSSDPQHANALVNGVSALDGILGVQLGLSDAGVTGVPTKERSLRGKTVEVVFEGVVLVEALERAELERQIGAIEDLISASPIGLAPDVRGIYDLTLVVEKQPC